MKYQQLVSKVSWVGIAGTLLYVLFLWLDREARGWDGLASFFVFPQLLLYCILYALFALVYDTHQSDKKDNPAKYTKSYGVVEILLIVILATFLLCSITGAFTVLANLWHL